MTAQLADRMVNDHPRVKLDGLHLYGVGRGDIHSRSGWGERYPFATLPAPPADVRRCSALWRGYVSTFRLHPDGRLELVGYDYMLSPGRWRSDPVGEWLGGDFWLVFKRSFRSPRTYLPFLDGLVVEDEAAWVQERRATRRER